MDPQTLLALYRTRLAEQRAAVTLVQFGILLVTLPLTIHAALLLLAQQHPGASRLHALLPLWLVLGALLAAGAVLTAWAARRLLRVSRGCAELRRLVDETLRPPALPR